MISAFDDYEYIYFRRLKNMEDKVMYQNVPTKVLTGEVRLSYVHLSQPYANPNQPNSEPKYSVTLLIPKTDQMTYQDIINSRNTAYENAVLNEWKGLRPQLRSLLIYDGDGARNDGAAFGEECKGHWVITASSKCKPQVVDISNVNVELAPQDIYSGMYARVTLNFFSFNSGGNKGVGCGLGNVMKTRDGEPLSGGATAAQDFDGIAVPAAVVGGVGGVGGVVPQAAVVPAGVYVPGAASTAAPGVQTTQSVAGAASVYGMTGGINPITGQLM